MAIYHCSCKVISRGKGRSAVASSAYRSGDKLTSEYDRRSYDYTKKDGVVYSEIMLCDNAPKEFQNREKLWNEVEKIEKGSNARLAREYEVALPRELNKEEQINLTRDFVQENFVKKGMCADFAIHDKGDGNPHAHIMITVRQIEQDGSWGGKSVKLYVCKNAEGEEKSFTAKELSESKNKEWQKQYDQKKQTYKCKTVKANDWDTAEFLRRNREAWANAINHEMEKKNLPERVDHRSLKEQGVERIPTIHVGPTATNMEREAKEKGITLETRKGNQNREIKKANEELKEVKKEIRETQRSIYAIQTDLLWSRCHESCDKLEKQLNQNPDNEKVQRDVLKQIAKFEVDMGKLIETEQKYKFHADKFYGEENNKISYLDFHSDKAMKDLEYLKAQATKNLLEIDMEKNPQKYELESAEQEIEVPKENAMQQHQPEPAHADLQKSAEAQAVPFDVESIAKKLEEHREVFVRATIKSQDRTFYQENPIYERQAVEISEISKAYKEQSATIQNLKEQKEKLGAFKFKEKKALDNKITNFERLRMDNENKLKAYGISDPAKADEKILELKSLAEQEKVKVQIAKENAGAGAKANEAEKSFIALAQTVPENMKQAVQEKMEQFRGKVGDGKISVYQIYQADKVAKNKLDIHLKQKQEKQQEHSKNRNRNGRGGRAD